MTGDDNNYGKAFDHVVLWIFFLLVIAFILYVVSELIAYDPALIQATIGNVTEHTT